MERKESFGIGDIVQMLQTLLKEQKPDRNRLTSLIEGVYSSIIIDLAQDGLVNWRQRHSTENFQIGRNTFWSAGETFLGLLILAMGKKDASLVQDLIRIMLSNRQDLASIDWESVVYCSYINDLTSCQIQALVNDCSNIRVKEVAKIDFLNRLHSHDFKSFNEQARIGMFRYFQSIIPEINKQNKYQILSTMLDIYNRDAKYLADSGGNISYSDQKDSIGPEPFVLEILSHIDIYEDKGMVEGLILKLPEMDHVLKSPCFGWGYKGTRKDSIFHTLCFLLKWCFEKKCSTHVLNRLCHYLCCVGFSESFSGKGIVEWFYQYNPTSFVLYAQRLMNDLISNWQDHREMLSRKVTNIFLQPSRHNFYRELIQALHGLSLDKKRIMWEVLILSDAITANNIMLFYNGMTREESSILAQLLIEHQKPLQFAENKDSKSRPSFRLGSAQMPCAPLALTQEALSCNFKGADEKRGGEQLNMLGWLLYHDLLPVSMLKTVVNNSFFTCHRSIHESAAAKFASHNHFLVMLQKADTKNLPKEVIYIVMLYLVSHDLTQTIEPLAQAQEAYVQADADARACARARNHVLCLTKTIKKITGFSWEVAALVAALCGQYAEESSLTFAPEANEDSPGASPPGHKSSLLPGG